MLPNQFFLMTFNKNNLNKKHNFNKKFPREFEILLKTKLKLILILASS